MTPKPSVTIRLGALHDEVTVDGRVFDRSKMTKRERSFMRNVIIDTLVKTGSVVRQ